MTTEKGIAQLTVFLHLNIRNSNTQAGVGPQNIAKRIVGSAVFLERRLIRAPGVAEKSTRVVDDVLQPACALLEGKGRIVFYFDA